MSDSSDYSDAAFQELIGMLEEAVRVGVTSISLEFEDQGLIVYYQAGNMGLGAARIPKELQRAVVNELFKRAGLARKAKGKMPVTLLGKDCEVLVETYESFGESVFNLTIRERKKKSAR